VDVRPWLALQEWIAGGSEEVGVPFAPALADAIPASGVRLRRDFGAVLNLIRSHALLHQAGRARDAEGRIIATLDDYAAVRELVADLVAEGVGIAVATSVRETVDAVRKLIAEGKPTPSVADVARLLGLDKSAASRRVAAARGLGFLVNEEDRKGRTARLTLGSLMPEETGILPPVEGLAAEFSKLHEGVEPDPPDRCTVAGNSEGVSPSPGSSNSDADAASKPGLGDLYGLFDRERGGE
jgi:hypothetical protein